MDDTMCNKDDPTYTPRSCSRELKGQEKNSDASVLPKNSSPELCEGYRILLHLMKISKFFLEQPDCKKRDTLDYYDVISKPMWLYEIRRKFVEGDYKNIGEFVSDVRLLLVNCYRYFGPNKFPTKRALRVEKILDQKIMLLPTELRNQCALEATHGVEFAETYKLIGDNTSHLLQSVIGDQAHRENERKILLSLEYEKLKEGEEHELLLWEQESLLVGKNQENMRNMWELPVIGHFLTLLLEQLNIDCISMFELERIFLMPQASKCLASLMTALLSSPMEREKLREKPPMPYKIWNRKLGQKVSDWYRKYIKSDKNPDFLFQKYGIEHKFWKIMGESNPLEEYEFHELTYHQRVSLIKAYCDFILHKHQSIREHISLKTDEFDSCLGQDSLGGKFLYFPLFLNNDVRIYRQAPEPRSWIQRDLDHDAELKAKESANRKLCSTNKRRRRTHSWQRGIIDSRRKVSRPKSSVQTKNNSKHKTSSATVGVKTKSTKLGVCMNLEIGASETPDISGQSSKSTTVSENIKKECTSSHTSKLSGQIDSKDLKQTYVISREVKFKVENSQFCNNTKLKKEDTLSTSEKKVEPLIVVREKNDFMVKESACMNVEIVPSYETKNVSDAKVKLDNVPKLRSPLHNPYWLEPDPNDFNLVADSVDEVRQLLQKYCGVKDESVLNEQLKKKPGKILRPSTEVKFARCLTSLVTDLEATELKYVINTKRTRAKLFKEWQEFRNRSADYIDTDEEFWLDNKSSVELPKVQNSQTNEDVLKDGKEFLITEAEIMEDLDTFAGGMKLRHHRLEDPISKLLQINTSDESSDVESDDSDWVMPKKRKRIRSKKIKNFTLDLMSPSKRKAVSQKDQKATIEQSKMVPDPSPEIMIVNEIPNKTSKQQEQPLFVTNVSSGENANHHLLWVNNHMKSAVKQSTAGQCAVTSSSTNNANSNVVVSVNSAVHHVNQRERTATHGVVITRVRGMERGNVVSPASEMKSTNLIDHVEKCSAEPSVDSVPNTTRKFNGQNSIVGTSPSTSTNFKRICYKTTKAQEKVLKDIVQNFKASDLDISKEKPVVLVPSSVDEHQTVFVVVGQQAKEILDNSKKSQSLHVPAHLMTHSLSSISTTPKFSSTSAAVLKKTVNNLSKTCIPDPTGPPSNPGQNTKNNGVAQNQIVQQLETQTKVSRKNDSEIICISDDSDNSEVEFLDKVYNPKLDRHLPPKKPRTKCLFQRNQFGNVQGETSTVAVKEVSSPTQTCKIATTSSNQSQTSLCETKSTLLKFESPPSYHVDSYINNISEHVNNKSQIRMELVGTTSSILKRNVPSTNDVFVQNQNSKPHCIAETIMSPTVTQNTHSVSVSCNSNSTVVTTNQPVCEISTYNVNTARNIATSVTEVQTPEVSRAQTIHNSAPRPSSLLQTQIPSFQLVKPRSYNAPSLKTNSGATLNQARNSGTAEISQAQSGITNASWFQPISPGTFQTQPRTPGMLHDQSRLVNTHPHPHPHPRIFSSLQTQPRNLHVQPRTPFTAQIRPRTFGTPQSQITPSTLHPQSRLLGASQIRPRNYSPSKAYGSMLIDSRTHISNQHRITGSLPIQPRTLATTLVQTVTPNATLQTRIPESPQSQMGSCGSPLIKVRSPSLSYSQVRNRDSPSLQVRGAGSSSVQISSTSASQMYVGGSRSSGVVERSPYKVQQHLNQTTARLVVIPGDENTGSNYALILPNGEKMILTSEQIADIRAANGGQLVTNVGLKIKL